MKEPVKEGVLEKILSEIDDTNITFLGLLRNFSPLDVLNLVNLQRKTGIVVFISDENSVIKRVFFKEGEIIYATSNQNTDRLGESLIRAGKLSWEDLDRSAKKITPQRRLGKILVEDGIISPKELFFGVRKQVEEIIFSLFTLTNGYFYFIEGQYEQENIVKFTMSTQSLLMDGMRRMDELKEIKDELFNEGALIIQSYSNNVKRLKGQPLKVYNNIGDGIDIKTLQKKTEVSEYDLLLTILNLKSEGYIDLKRPGTKSKTDEMKEKMVEPESQQIEDIVININLLLIDTYSIISSRAKGINYLDYFNSFFEGLPKDNLSLFNGIRIEENGGIDVERLFENMKKSDINNKEETLLKTLKELLFFELFELKTYLKGNEAEELLSILKEIQ